MKQKLWFRFLALDILRQRMLVLPEIGPNWVSRFVKRHKELKLQFSTPKDKDRMYVENIEVIRRWYDLFSEQVSIHKSVDSRDGDAIISDSRSLLYKARRKKNSLLS